MSDTCFGALTGLEAGFEGAAGFGALDVAGFKGLESADLGAAEDAGTVVGGCGSAEAAGRVAGGAAIAVAAGASSVATTRSPIRLLDPISLQSRTSSRRRQIQRFNKRQQFTAAVSV